MEQFMTQQDRQRFGVEQRFGAEQKPQCATFYVVLLDVLRDEKLGAFFFGLGGADDEAVVHVFNNDGLFLQGLFDRSAQAETNEPRSVQVDEQIFSLVRVGYFVNPVPSLFEFHREVSVTLSMKNRLFDQAGIVMNGWSWLHTESAPSGTQAPGMAAHSVPSPHAIGTRSSLAGRSGRFAAPRRTPNR